MARIQYRPSARARGFNPQQLSTAGIDRMREESNRIIRGMERQNAAIEKQELQNLQAMRDNAAYQERMMRENQAIEMQNLQNTGGQRLANNQSSIQQSELNKQARDSIMSNLAQFSSTAKAVVDRIEADKTKEEVAKAHKAKRQTVNPDDVIDYTKGENTRAKAAVQLTTEVAANGVLKNEDELETRKGYIANHGLNGRSAQIVDNDIAYQGWSVVLNKYQQTSTKDFVTPDGVQYSGTEAQRDPYLMDLLVKKAMDDVFEYMGFPDPMYLSAAGKKIRDAAEAYRSGARTKALDEAIDIQEQRTLNLESTGESQDVLLAFVDRKSNKGVAAALDGIDKLIANPDLDPEKIRVNDYKGTGKTYDKEWPNRWKSALQKRNAAIVKRQNDDDALEKALDREWITSNIDAIINSYNENPEQAAMLVKQRYHSKGMTVPPVITGIEREAIKRNKDLTGNLVSQKTKFGILDLTFVNSIEDPTLQKTAREAYEQQELNKYGPESLGIKNGLKSTARNLTKIDPNEEQGSAQTFLVNARLESEYLKQLKLTNDPLKALENVNQMVDAGRNGDKSSPFFRDTGFLNNRLVFPNIETSDREYQERSVYLDKKMLSRGIAVVDQPFTLATPDEMDAAYMSSVSGAMQYPPGVLRVADQFGLKPSEIFNAQRQANNAASGDKKPLLAPSPATDLIDNVPANVRKLFLSDVPAQINRGSAMVTGQLPMRSSMGGSSFNADVVPQGYGAIIQQKAVENNIPPEILAGLIDTESAFNPKAVSPVGAQGLGQFMPPTAAEFGVDVNDPVSSIDGAARYLRYLVDYFDGDMNLAIYAYNGGMGNIERYGGPIPGNKENEEYLQKVLNNATKYR